ncbi:phosphomannomutase [Loktanella sp. Alg231-35]|uniref:phosphomannomutase n=1 Tax=Loktanella sp. Alg231-35 TaxID=1922220 RepID=UPI000D5583D8|nr:phosphomannomutase [Loktanella sp. Alg231-35]
MAPKFGTSGLRGLVTELTSDCVSAHVQAFIASCRVGTGLFIGHDLRESSPALAQYVADAARRSGIAATLCGPVPTPALALAAMSAGAGAVMITGSHIPADRNGLKFYSPGGEITKQEEQAILGALDQIRRDKDGPAPTVNETAPDAYQARYQSAFMDALDGLTVGIYDHSAVGRDLLASLLQSLGASVMSLGRSDVFVPVDTEAVSDAMRAQLRAWAKEHPLDAIISTDADGDRPLLTDEAGEVVPGDILGQITAQRLRASHVVTPISSNSGVALSGDFAKVICTKIGSPYVIAEMEAIGGDVVGYEANGGFLLGFEAKGPSGSLPPLLTRDAVLPLLIALSASPGAGVAALVATQPPRFTAADRLQEVATDKTAALLTRMIAEPAVCNAILSDLDLNLAAIDQTDGLRMTMTDGTILHFRPSGNAPEMRIYVEAMTAEMARKHLNSAMQRVAKELLLQ